MIEDPEDFKRIYAKLYNLRFQMLFSESWDDYQMELARDWIQELEEKRGESDD